ncbi:MAG: PAS domain S-box protein [Desulfuromonadaceae bacterium]|nr:PAS domain S-box protein [Desulfuromonadaceae bacterium]
MSKRIHHEARRAQTSLLWFVLARFFVVTLFLGGTVFWQFLSSEYDPPKLNIRLLLILTCSFLQNCFSLFFLLRRREPSSLFVQWQLVWDLVLCAAVVYVTGGMFSRFAFLFIFVILSSGLLCHAKEVLGTLSASVVLYGGLANLHYYGLLPASGFAASSPMTDGQDVFFLLFLNLTAFFLTGFLSFLLARRLQHAALLLDQKKVEHEDLEQLNLLILRHIAGGLIVVDAQGLICSFNASAESMTGVAAENAIGCHVQQVFPAFPWQGAVTVERREFVFQNSRNEQRTVGYRVVPLSQDQRGRSIVAFQDLTEVKRLERNLQREERLAAVGGLAAGLAHEIRNPLAALSSSVQMLQEQLQDEQQQRLMAIVARESERLNLLLSDFLVFARPRPPHKRSVDLCGLLGDLCLLLKTSKPFEHVELKTLLPESWLVEVDKEQMIQAAWDLLVNAASFSPQGGVVTCAASPQDGCFWVEDEGPGVEPEHEERIFEPFFTTRAEGTGLGLAIAYALIKAQGWSLEYQRAFSGGARFVVRITQPDENGN